MISGRLVRGCDRRLQAIDILVTPSPCLLVISRAGVTDLRELGLNERQIEALRLMVNEGREMTSRLYQEMFDVYRNTASRDLARLMDTDWVKRLEI
jgi:predicted HTH transcriptional regulator